MWGASGDKLMGFVALGSKIPKETEGDENRFNIMLAMATGVRLG